MSGVKLADWDRRPFVPVALRLLWMAPPVHLFQYIGIVIIDERKRKTEIKGSLYSLACFFIHIYIYIYIYIYRERERERERERGVSGAYLIGL
jgi:hypothetical protein